MINGKFLVMMISLLSLNIFSNAQKTNIRTDSIRLPDVQPVRTDQHLKEITIYEKKQPIEKHFGKTVINVENSILATGSSVFEILGRSPGLFIDQDDNIRLKGKPGVIIMIDGKTVQLKDADLANMLKGIPSNAIEKIEIIENPGARYDAAGNAGIINIKMKKIKTAGTNGSLMATLGQGMYPKQSIGVNFNFRKGKINVFGNYSYSYRKSFSNPVLYRAFRSQDTLQGAYRQNDFIKFPFYTNIARVGMDYMPSSSTTVGFVVNGLQNKFYPNGNNFSTVLDQYGHEQSTFTTKSHGQDVWDNYSVNANLRHAFDTLGQEITIDLDYARYWNRTYQTFINNYFYPDGSPLKPTYILYGELPGNLDIKSAKTDYALPLGGNHKLEAGLKYSYVQSDNNIKFYDKSNVTPLYDSSKSNHFVYSENINAAYINLSGKFRKIEYQAGLRMEQTNTKSSQLASNQTADTNYLQLFPSILIKYSLNKHHDLSFSANRRIDRPTYKQLNPFKFYIDPTTYVTGNPYLRPQETINIELSHTLNQKLTTSFSYSVTKDNITEVLYPSETEDKVTVQTNKNLRQAIFYSLTISLPSAVTKWWNTETEVIVYRGIYKGNLANTNLSGGNTTFNINSTNSFSLGKGYNAELGFEYRAAEAYGYYYIKPIWQLNAGLQKSIFGGKGSIKLNCTDIFYTYVIKGSTSFTDYYESFTTAKETRIATLSLNYRFGKNPGAPAHGKNGGAEDEKRRASVE